MIKKKQLKKYLSISSIFGFIVVLANIFIAQKGSDLFYLSIIPLYLVIFFITKNRSFYTFLFCILLLFITAILYLINGPDPRTENASVWFVLFFISGIIQKWMEK